MWSSVAAILASRAGLRNAVHMTIVPSSTRWVASAIAARIVQHSWMPVVGAVEPEQQVVEHPHRIETGRLRGLRDGPDLAVRWRRIGTIGLLDGQHDPDLQLAPSATSSGEAYDRR